MTDLNYDFMFWYIAILFAIGATFSSCKELFDKNNKNFNFNLMATKIVYFILIIPAVGTFLLVIFSLHDFCYELYNAIQESGLTVKEFVEMIQ